MKSNKTRVCRNPACGVEFTLEVQGQRFCTPCRHARAEAAGKVCQCGGISDVIGGKCWPCRREALDRESAKREQAQKARISEATPEASRRSLLGRFAEMPRDVQLGYVADLLRLMGVGQSEFINWFDYLPLETQREVYRQICAEYAKLGIKPTTVEEVNPEEVPATNQEAIDSAFYDLLGGVL